MVHLFDRDDGFENGAFAVLNPLSHRVQIGCEIDRCGENAFVFLAFALAVQLFPPLRYIVQFRVEIDQNFDFFARFVQFVTHGGILCSRIFVEILRSAHLLHAQRAGHQLANVESGSSDGQQTHRRQHRKTSAHIVGNDKCFVALLRSQRAQSAARFVGDAHNQLLGSGFALLFFELRFQQAECQRRLGRRARLRNRDDAETLGLEHRLQLVQVIFADVLTGINDNRCLVLFFQPLERIGERFVHGFGTKVTTADADHHHHFALVAQGFGRSLYGIEFDLDVRRQTEPAQKIVAFARTFVQHVQTLGCFRCILFYGVGRHKAKRFLNVQSNVFHNQFAIFIFVIIVVSATSVFWSVRASRTTAADADTEWNTPHRVSACSPDIFRSVRGYILCRSNLRLSSPSPPALFSRCNLCQSCCQTCGCG